MTLDLFDAELEVGRAVAFDAHLLIILLANFASLSHINGLRQ